MKANQNNKIPWRGIKIIKTKKSAQRFRSGSVCFSLVSEERERKVNRLIYDPRITQGYHNYKNVFNPSKNYFLLYLDRTQTSDIE